MWTVASVAARGLVEQLRSEAAVLDGHAATWLRHLPPLLRNAAQRIAALESRLVLKEDEIVELRRAAVIDALEVVRAEARAVKLCLIADQYHAAACDLDQIRAALLHIEEVLTDALL